MAFGRKGYHYVVPFEQAPPEPLVSERLVIRPQRPSDNEPDHDAVMANREWLRRWSGSAWPADDFSVDDNLRDLAEHVIEHDKRIAYGFTIAGDDEVLGSLYINDVKTLIDGYNAPAEVAEILEAAVARVDLWVRLDRAPALFAEVVAAAIRWLDREGWAPLVWCARLDCPEMVRAYRQAGLELIGKVENDRGRVQLIFALGANVRARSAVTD